MSGSIENLRTIPIYNANKNIDIRQLTSPTSVEIVSEKVQRCKCHIIPPHMEKAIDELRAQNETTKSSTRKKIKHIEHGKKLRIGRRIEAKKIRSAHIKNIRKGKAALVELNNQPQTSIRPAFKVYSAGNKENTPGTLKRSGSVASTDQNVNEAYDGGVDTYNFYYKLFGRNSYNGIGGDFISTVHYGSEFDNAFWNGQQMVYGDGDGTIFNRFTIAKDVIGHELTHGVTQYLSKLRYKNQQGALNEHISDFFGLCIKYWSNDDQGYKTEVNGLIGEGLLKPYNGRAQALRSFAAPGRAYETPQLGKDPQPGSMSAYVKTTDDDGGVHINSGILNHSSWLVFTDLKYRDENEKFYGDVAKIWWDAVSKIKYNANFVAFADQTVASATELFGKDSKQLNAVRNAWISTEVKIYK